jgi:hypothetical protein
MGRFEVEASRGVKTEVDREIIVAVMQGVPFGLTWLRARGRQGFRLPALACSGLGSVWRADAEITLLVCHTYCCLLLWLGRFLVGMFVRAEVAWERLGMKF